MLLNAFQSTIFPYLVQIGAILFGYCIITAAYGLFRQHNFQMFVDKLKAGIIAYMCVKGAFTIVNFINKLIEGIKI
jgi:hypothetical protein